MPAVRAAQLSFPPNSGNVVAIQVHHLIPRSHEVFDKRLLRVVIRIDFLRHVQRRARQDHRPVCPKVLGIDEHFFTRKKGYATTFCDLK
jgi:hypothetical protein